MSIGAETFQGPSSTGLIIISEGLIMRETWLGSSQVAQARNIIRKKDRLP